MQDENILGVYPDLTSNVAPPCMAGQVKRNSQSQMNTLLTDMFQYDCLTY